VTASGLFALLQQTEAINQSIIIIIVIIIIASIIMKIINSPVTLAASVLHETLQTKNN